MIRDYDRVCDENENENVHDNGITSDKSHHHTQSPNRFLPIRFKILPVALQGLSASPSVEAKLFATVSYTMEDGCERTSMATE